MTFQCLNSVFILTECTLDGFNNFNKNHNHKGSYSDHYPLCQTQMGHVEELIESRYHNGCHQENKGNWDRPVKGLVLEESHFKDRLIDRFHVKGMEQLD